MQVKISLHLQRDKDWVPSYLIYGAMHVKYLDLYPVFPGATTICRPYYPQHLVRQRINEGADGAFTMFNAVWSSIVNAPDSVIFESPANETWDETMPESYVPFTQQMTMLFHDHGRKIITGGVNPGWPMLVKDDGGKQLDLLARAVEGADGVAFHEGGVTDFDYPWRATRYRFFHEHTNGDHPPFYITELALDSPPGNTGWRNIPDMTWERYKEILLRYEQEIRQDDYVVSAHIFTTGGEGYGWDSFEIAKDQALDFAQAAADMPWPTESPSPSPPIPVEEMARGIDVSEYQKSIDWGAVKPYVVYVILRASYGAGDGLTHKDSYFERNRAECQRLKIPYGVYHYFKYDVNNQAHDFVEAVGDDDPPLGYWLDCEEGLLAGERVQRGLDAMWNNFGIRCGLYSNPNMMSKFNLSQGDTPFWIAHYNAEYPDTDWDWDFWQWKVAKDGTIPGIDAAIDLDRYNGTKEEFCEKYGCEEEPVGNVAIYDKDGAKRDLAWLQEKFGPVFWDESAYESAYRLIELREKEGPASITVTLLDENGDLQSGIEVVRFWPGADPLPEWPPPPERWKAKGVHDKTENGRIGFGMGGGDYYFPPDAGATVIWVARTGYGSDAINGLGMLGGTNHIHLEPTFQLIEGEPPSPSAPSPSPSEPPSSDVLEELQKIRKILEGGFVITPR